MRKIVFFLFLAIAAILLFPLVGKCQIAIGSPGLHVVPGDTNFTVRPAPGAVLDMNALRASIFADNGAQWTLFQKNTDILVLVDKNELGRVLRVWDGDTYQIQLAEKTTIRLFGVDCPETYSGYVTKTQPYGRAATDSLRKFIYGKILRYQIKGADRYGRTLATVYLGRKDVALWLLEKGLAWVYPDDGNPETPYLSKSQERRYKAAQRKAQKNKVGLWAGYVDGEGDTVAPVEPWVWRKINSPNAGAEN